MQSERVLILEFILVTAAAVVAVYFATITLVTNKNQSVETAIVESYPSLSSGKNIPEWKRERPASRNTADFINQNFPIHLVSPEWMLDDNQSRMIRDWLTAEKEARLGVIAVLWLGISSLIVWRHRRNWKKP